MNGIKSDLEPQCQGLFGPLKVLIYSIWPPNSIRHNEDVVSVEGGCLLLPWLEEKLLALYKFEFLLTNQYLLKPLQMVLEY